MQVIIKKLFFVALSFALPLNLNLVREDNQNVQDNVEVTINQSSSSSSKTDENEFKQYIGYGYNIAGGKALSDIDSLNYNSPILDVNNQTLKDKIKVFSMSQTTYVSNTSSLVSEIAESYGQALSGGVAANAKISAATVNVSTKFNTNKNTSWTQTAKEEYSYYSIYSKAKPVVLQMQSSEIKKYLDENFKKDLYAVDSEEKAQKLFKKYGTHLLTGYTLGGIFEMTNYFATQSSSYVRESSTTFNSQVSASFSAIASGNTDFSFGQTYGLQDNNSQAVNNYKCTTYGGYSFPGLTMDQAFKYYETAISAGFIYDIWTNSINEGKNLVIVDIPQSSEAIPLWNLLPNENKYTDIRNYLINEYVKNCGDTLNAYFKIYKDIIANVNVSEDNDDDDDAIQQKGYQFFNKITSGSSSYYLSSYVSDSNKNSTIRVKPDSYVVLDLDYGDYDVSSLKWSISASSIEYTDSSNNSRKYVDIIDNQTVVIKIDENFKDIKKFTLNCTDSLGNIVFEKAFQYEKLFSGGDGSETNPFLIRTTDDFKNITNEYVTGKYYFKQVSDLDFKNTAIRIGSFSQKFSGVYDGNYKTIKRITIENISGLMGIFPYNSGTIENIYFENIRLYNTAISYKYEDVTKATTNVNIVTNGGIVSGINDGKIINCHSSNSMISSIQNRRAQQTSQDELTTIYIGGIVGTNLGSILDCSSFGTTITNSLYDARVGKNEVTLVSGGIVGSNESEDEIENAKSYRNKIVVKGEANESSTINEYAGGIIGYLFKGSINSALVSTFSGTNACFEVDSKKETAFIGGFIGCIDESCYNDKRVKNSVIYSVDEAAIKGENNEYNGRLIIGKYSKATDSFENILIIKSGDENTPLCIDENKREFTTKNISTKVVYMINNSSFNWQDDVLNNDNEVCASITANAIWCTTNSGAPDINYKTIKKLSDIDASNVKVNFYNDNAFSMGKLLVYPDYSYDSGDYTQTFFVKDFYDNLSVAQNKTKVYVSIDENDFYNDFAKTYTIYVTKAKVQDLVIQNNNANFTYYEDFLIDFSNYKLSAILQNGKQEEITLNNCIVKVNNKEVTIQDESGYVDDDKNIPLVKGNNTITFTYDNYTETITINAQKREVVGVTVTNKDELRKKDYYVGTTNVYPEDIQVEVTYNVGRNKIISGSECELIYSTIAINENTVIVCYGNYVYDMFSFIGKVNVSSADINEFISNVNAINTNQSLIEQYNQIQKCIISYKIFDGTVPEEIKDSYDTLQTIITNYNNEIHGINNDFTSSIIITNQEQLTCTTNSKSIISIIFDKIVKWLKG